MAPSSSVNRDQRAEVNEEGEDGQSRWQTRGCPSSADLPRDPLEVKYRDFFWTYTEGAASDKEIGDHQGASRGAHTLAPDGQAVSVSLTRNE